MILKNYSISFHSIPHMFIWELQLGVISIDYINILDSFKNGIQIFVQNLAAEVPTYLGRIVFFLFYI